MYGKDCKGWYVPWICGFCVKRRKCDVKNKIPMQGIDKNYMKKMIRS